MTWHSSIKNDPLEYNCRSTSRQPRNFFYLKYGLTRPLQFGSKHATDCNNLLPPSENLLKYALANRCVLIRAYLKSWFHRNKFLASHYFPPIRNMVLLIRWDDNWIFLFLSITGRQHSFKSEKKKITKIQKLWIKKQRICQSEWYSRFLNH